MSSAEKVRLEKIDDVRWRIPRTGGMRVDGIIYTSEGMLRDLSQDESPKQVANVAHLPGIQRYSLAMPDIHWGYGFPIGGVAAFDWKEGVISPGGVGYDINCGTRLLRSNLSVQDLRPRIKDLAQALFESIPSGVGSKGALRLSSQELRQVLKRGIGLGGEPGLWVLRGCGPDRRSGLHGRGRPGRGRGSGHGAGPAAAGHPGVRKPLSGSRICGGNL